MVYCLWNKKKKKYLKNNFKFIDGDGSCLNFCDSFSPQSCGWMIRRIEGKVNQYSLFSMSKFTHRDDKIGETLMSLVTLDPIGPIYKAIRNGYDFPFNQEFITPFFSSLSSSNNIHMEQFSNEENSWCIVEADHPGLSVLYDTDNGFKPEEIKLDYEKTLDFNKIRISCSSDSDCTGSLAQLKSGDMYKRGSCGEKFCDKVYGRCISGRKYGEFCNAFLGERDCGKDSNGKQMICKIMFDFNKMNACRYRDRSQDTNEFCGKVEECKNYKTEGCTGSDSQRKIGKGICRKLKNGEPTHVAQTGCGTKDSSVWFHKESARKCESGYACGGYCSCRPPTDGGNPNNGGCPSDHFCDWWSGHTRKCLPKRDNGQPTGEGGQSGCSTEEQMKNNHNFVVRCKSGYSCGNVCSCKHWADENHGGCKSGYYCDWYTGGSRTCKKKLKTGEVSSWGNTGCGGTDKDATNGAKKCETGWVCGSQCSCKHWADENHGGCKSGYYCDWYTGGSKTCKKKLKTGEVSSLGNTGCGGTDKDATNGAKKCETGWVCGSQCSCKHWADENHVGGCKSKEKRYYCDWCSYVDLKNVKTGGSKT